MPKKYRIGIIGFDRDTVNYYTILWTNYIARSKSIKFLYGTDSYYFENLIKLTRGQKLNTRIYLSFNIISTKLFLEFYPIILLEHPSKTYFNLMDSIAFLLDHKKQADHIGLLRYVYSVASKRRLFSRKIRKPAAIILFDSTVHKMIENFVKSRFSSFKIFYLGNSINYINKNTDFKLIPNYINKLRQLSEPLKWLLSRKISNQILAKIL